MSIEFDYKSKKILSFLTVKDLISLIIIIIIIIILEIYVGMSLNIWKLAKDKSTRANLWTTLFTCLLMNLTLEFTKLLLA
jgi:ABC-type sulfate transport system permease component